MAYILQTPAPTHDIVVDPPAAGQVLAANSAGAWQGQALASVASVFGTPQTLTAALTTVTPAAAPGSPDYAWADAVNGGWGFSTHDEALTMMAIIVNLQTRLAQVETKLKALTIAA